MGDPDIIYVVRRGEQNEELRYSLRSLTHLPHNRVFMAGYIPSWVRNVTTIPVLHRHNKFESIESNLRAALRHPEMGERAVYFNDDFYVMEPIPDVPVMHRGPVDLRRFTQEFRIRMATTLDAVRGAAQFPPLDYELHVPLPLVTDQARELMLRRPSHPRVMWRTWYGNMAQLGGFEALDVKSRAGEVHDSCLLSSSPKAMRSLRPYFEERLPRSMYE